MNRRQREELSYWMNMGSNVVGLLGQLYGAVDTARQKSKAQSIHQDWQGSLVNPSTATPAAQEMVEMNGMQIPMQTFTTTPAQQRTPTAEDLASLYAMYGSSGIDPQHYQGLTQPIEYGLDARTRADEAAYRQSERAYTEDERRYQQQARAQEAIDKAEEKRRRELADKQASTSQLINLFLQHGNQRLNPDPRAIQALQAGLDRGELVTEIPNPRYGLGGEASVIGPELNTIPVFEPDMESLYQFMSPYILDGQMVVPRYDKRSGEVTVVPLSKEGVRMGTKKTGGKSKKEKIW